MFFLDYNIYWKFLFYERKLLYMKEKNLFKRIISAIVSLSMISSVCVPAFADAGEPPPEITEDEYVFPDPDSFSYDDVEVNFAKALQYSLYFYDANKCGAVHTEMDLNTVSGLIVDNCEFRRNNCYFDNLVSKSIFR
jgi:hypothetical protein